MKIETNRVAAYLAGNFPPYYESFPKVEFILLLSAKAASVFLPDKFDLIEKHTSSLQQFFSESLNLLKDRTELLIEIVDALNVPFEARGADFVQPKNQGLGKPAHAEKTIGFITPFDEEMGITQKFVEEILRSTFPGWKIEKAKLQQKDGKFLWNSIESFLQKYPVYLADVRDGNLNVALEIGYLLGERKDDAKIVFIVNEDVKISDLQGMIRIAKHENDTKAGESPKRAANRQKEINKKLKDGLKSQFKSLLI